LTMNAQMIKMVGVSAEGATGWKRWWWMFKARVEVWLRGGRKRRAIHSFYRGSPWCYSGGIPATCGRIGRGFGAMAATVRGDGVMDDTRHVEHRYVGGQTTVKIWSWCKKWDEKTSMVEYSLYFLSWDHHPEFMMIGSVSPVGPKI
jgi:hypothetical protein